MDPFTNKLKATIRKRPPLTAISSWNQFQRRKKETGRIAAWSAPSHLCLQEPPHGPLLLDAFAARVNGHAERQDDDDEQAPDNASCYQRCPAEPEEKRNNINIGTTLRKLNGASETADPPTCCYTKKKKFTVTKYDAENQNGGEFGIVAAFSDDNDEPRKEGILYLQQRDASKEKHVFESRRTKVLRFCSTV